MAKKKSAPQISPTKKSMLSADPLEKNFHTNEEKLQWLNTIVDNLIFIIDAKGILIECYEPTWIGDLCFSCRKWQGKKFQQIDFSVDAKKIFEATMRKIKKTGKVEKLEYNLEVKGKKLLLEARLSPLKTAKGLFNGVVIVSRNITEEKAKEQQLNQHLVELENAKKAMVNLLEDIEAEKNKSQALAKDLEKFKLAVDNVSDHIIITTPDAKIIYANHAVETITGYPNKEIMGKDPFNLWGGHMEKEFYDSLWNTIKIKKETFYGEITNRRKNGEEYIADVHLAPILDDQKEIIFYVGIERDVTKLKEIDKMKSEFVSVVSHQLRTPLTGIKWYAQFLIQNEAGPLTPEQKDFMEQIYNSNERMIKLVNDLLNVSRIESGKRFTIAKQDTDIVTVLRETIEHQMILARDKKIEIICDPPLTKKIIAFIDGEKIQQAVQNLLNNAIKYSFLNKKITIGHKKEKDNFLFFIKDQGLGITQLQQGRIFEKFFRADNILSMDTDGTGLGLYIAKAIIEGHGGKISFKSKENEGTTFSVSLPIHGTASEVKNNREAAQTKTEKKDPPQKS